MKIEYKKGKMIVTHPSGHVDTYDKTYLIRFRADRQKSVDDERLSIAEINKCISAVEISEAQVPGV